MSIRELQNSLRDGVILFRALLEELREAVGAQVPLVAGLTAEALPAGRPSTPGRAPGGGCLMLMFEFQPWNFNAQPAEKTTTAAQPGCISWTR